MSRNRPALPAPTPERVGDVPAWPPAALLWRAVASHHEQPWWFSSRDPDAPGRFDLEAPAGTCYWSDDPAAALLERHIDHDAIDPIIDVADLDGTVLWAVTPRHGIYAADLTSTHSPVTKEVSTHTPYSDPGGPWDWADALTATGQSWEAIVAWTRVAPGPTRTIAVFGQAQHTAGQPQPPQPPHAWPDAAPDSLGYLWTDELGRHVSDPPRSADIDLLP